MFSLLKYKQDKIEHYFTSYFNQRVLYKINAITNNNLSFE